MKLADEQAFAVWFTGLPAAGKSTIASALARLLRAEGIQPIVLDSDDLRALLTPEARYDAETRQHLYHQLGGIAALLVRQQFPVIIAATGNLRSYRDEARKLIPRFFEVYVDTSLETCMARDPKGIYRKGRDGIHQHVPGLQVAYEPPLNPDAIVHGQGKPPETAARDVANKLVEIGFLALRT